MGDIGDICATCNDYCLCRATCAELATLRAQVEALTRRAERAEGLLSEALTLAERPRHDECEDGFYACPKAEGYFGQYEGVPVAERPCECGADRVNKAVRQIRARGGGR